MSCTNCRKAYRGVAVLTRHEPDEHCPERHEHCAQCQRIVSRGDWDAKPIATYRLPLSGRIRHTGQS